jgi:hypothetical protein
MHTITVLHCAQEKVIYFPCYLYFVNNNRAFISNKLQVLPVLHFENYLLDTCKTNFRD